MSNLEKITLAGGCFWCTEAIFKRLKGVEKVTSGYASSKRKNPSYEEVVLGQTGAVEAIQVEFDPKIISFEKILDIFWATHDPTSLNRQGEDVGTQYRSGIYYQTKKQKELILLSKKKQEQSGKLSSGVVTEILPFENFYKAEEYHQNYYDQNPNASYCSLVIDPKIEKLIKQFNFEVKDEYK